MLRSLKSKSDLPWAVIGDFNDISSQAKKRGVHQHPGLLIEGFNAALEDCGLIDLGLYGYPFTWERGRGTANWVEERLDRAVGNGQWCSRYSQARVENIGAVSSDHSMFLLEWDRGFCRKPARGFKFENAWLLDKYCDVVVNNAWKSSIHLNLPERIWLCGKDLQQWGGAYYQNFQKKKNSG